MTPARVGDPYALPEGWDVLGRPLRPVALGLAFLCAILAVANATGADAIGDSPWRYVLAAFAALDAVAFLAGWWTGRGMIVRVALLAAVGIHVARAALLALVLGVSCLAVPDLWQGLAVVVIAGGSYLLEKGDQA
jgi:hypothetical protein